MSTYLKLALIVVLSTATASAPTAAESMATTGSNPTFKYIGKLAFGPDGVLFAADAQEVSITALLLAQQMAGGTPGTMNIPGGRSEDRRSPWHRCQEPPHHRHGGEPDLAEYLHLGHAGAGGECHTGPPARRRRGEDRCHRFWSGPVFTDRATQCASRRDAAGARREKDSGRQLSGQSRSGRIDGRPDDYAHGIPRRQALCLGPVERRVRIQDAGDSVPVRAGR